MKIFSIIKTYFTLPIKALGYAINKQDFRDGIYLRYGWEIPRSPRHCQCGKENNMNHALSCANGGFVMMRHNRIRNLEAELMREVGYDIKIEPELLPLGDNQLIKGNNSEKARLDVSGIGIWGLQERTFVDVRVINPNAPSYFNTTPANVYKRHEQEKKRVYGERIIEIEKSSFTPLIFSTSGGMGQEATIFHKRLASQIAEKRNEDYNHVMNYIRTRLRFCILKSTLVALRGYRGKKNEAEPISNISFNMIPSEEN